MFKPQYHQFKKKTEHKLETITQSTEAEKIQMKKMKKEKMD
jgi:hypothetical protein